MSKEEKLLLEYLHKNNLRYTPERKTVLDVFLAIEDHLSLDDLYVRVKAVQPKINHSTTYRTMKVLTEIGLAREWKGLDKRTYFEHNYKHDHHDHMVCEKCHTIFEFHEKGLEKLQEKIAREHGFIITNHQLTLYGVCKKCVQGVKQ